MGSSAEEAARRADEAAAAAEGSSAEEAGRSADEAEPMQVLGIRHLLPHSRSQANVHSALARSSQRLIWHQAQPCVGSAVS